MCALCFHNVYFYICNAHIEVMWRRILNFRWLDDWPYYVIRYKRSYVLSYYNWLWKEKIKLLWNLMLQLLETHLRHLKVLSQHVVKWETEFFHCKSRAFLGTTFGSQNGFWTSLLSFGVSLSSLIFLRFPGHE